MTYKNNYNERSWAIDVIGHIKLYVGSINRPIKGAGGENTVAREGGVLFPDVLLFGSTGSAKILQGWELKMPDTNINDKEFYNNAKKKAEILGLDSFVLWNVKTAHLYILGKDTQDFQLAKVWDEIVDIKTRESVQENSEKWETLCIDIIDTVNDYLDDGSLKGKRFIEAYSSGGVTSLILENTKLLSDEIKNKSNTDKLFKAEVTLWQDKNCQEYGSKKDSKVDSLSRAILSNWIGKFLFAHVLTSISSPAKKSLESINNITTVDEAINIFEEISIACNFWTIFSSSLGMNLVPASIWSHFLSFNNLLNDLKIGEIDQKQLSSILEDTVSISSRKLKGQYTTPKTLAKLLVALSLNNAKEDRVADFCSGSGTIIREVFEAKLKACTAEEVSRNVYASDLDYHANQVTTFALANPSGMDIPIRVFNADVFTLEPDYNVTFRDPKTGMKFEENLGKFDVILSNLPFISQNGRKVFSDSIDKIVDRLPMSCDFLDVDKFKSLDRKSDIYAYIPFKLHPLLKEGGCLGIIISNSWLGTVWGVGFLHQLVAHYHLKTVITSGAGRWFDNSEVVTNLLILEKRSHKDEKLGSIDFVTLKRLLDDLDDDDYLSSIASQILLGTVNSNESLEIRTIDTQNVFNFLNLGIRLNSQFSECDWIFDIPFVEVNTFLDSCRGERRGKDKLFYPSSDEGIEPDFLEPLLFNSKNIKGYLVSPEYSRNAFCCSASEQELLDQGKIGAYQWIQRFKNQNNDLGKPLPVALKRKGLHWYEFGNSVEADFVISMNPNKRFFIARVQTPSVINQRLICLKAKGDQDIDLLHALLNSVVAYFMIETSGFGRGLGVLDLNATSLKTMLMLDLNKLDEDQKASIKIAFKPLLAQSRTIHNIDEELELEDRIAFDKVILESFGIAHLQQKIYDSLIKLVSIRLEALN